MAARPQEGVRPAPKGDVAIDKAVYDAIRRAMLMGRLLPGTKLQEPALARVLKVSRERVRKALHRLVHEGWLEAVPNRGTFVPALTIEEVREIYDVRTMLETAIVRRLCAEHGAAGAPSASRRMSARSGWPSGATIAAGCSACRRVPRPAGRTLRQRAALAAAARVADALDHAFLAVGAASASTTAPVRTITPTS